MNQASKPSPGGSKRNHLSYSLLGCGTLAFIAFHFANDGTSQGWEIWTELFEMFKEPSLIAPQSMAVVAAVLTLTFTVLASLPLIHFFGHSRLIRTILAFFSAAAASVLIYFLLTINVVPMVVLLALAPVLTFFGLVCYRPERPKAPFSPPPQPPA